LNGIAIISHNILLLSIMMLIGYAAVKTGYISTDAKNMLSRIIVRITLPLLIVNSLTSVELDATRLKNSLFVIIAAVITIAILYIIGTGISKLLRQPMQTALIHRCMTAFGNIVFLGYPLIQALYGADGLFYAALYAFVNDLFVWTFVVWRLTVLNGGKKQSAKETLINCLNPPTIAFAVSFIMLIFDVKLGGAIKEVAGGMGGTTTYLSMIFIGGTLAEAKVSDLLKAFSTLLIVLIKMLIMPVILIFVMRMLPFDPLVKGVVVMQAAVPSQTIISVLTKEYGGDTDYVVKGIFITTVFGLLTMPFIYYLLSTFM